MALEQRGGVEVEDRLGLGMVAALHAVAGQAEHVAHAQRGRAQHVALDGDAVVVAAGDLHAPASSRRGSAARRSRRCDMWQLAPEPSVALMRVDPALEDVRAVVDVLRVGGIGRVQLGRDGELAAAQHALQPPARGVARQRRQRRVRLAGRYRRDAADSAGVSVERSWPAQRAGGGAVLRRGSSRARRAARRTRPCRRWSTGGCGARDRVAAAHHARRPPRPSPRRRASRDRPRNCRWRARRRRARCAGSWGSSSGRTCRSRTGCTGRTCGNRTARP